MIVSTTRTGAVFIKDFDRGVIETLGATVREATVKGRTKRSRFIDIPGVGTDIPIIFNLPEMTLERTRLPSIVLRREEPSFAANRWHSIADGYRMPVGDNVTVGGVVGKKNKEIKILAYPFDITYTLEGLTRLRNQANSMLNFLLRVYKPYGKILVKDSLGETRSYEAFVEGISNLDEVVDVSKVIRGFAVTIRVEGELDLTDPFTLSTTSQPIQINTAVK